MTDTLFSPIRLSDLEILVEKSVERALAKISQAREAADSWLDVDEFCEYHPEKPAKQTVYQWTANGEVPHHKRGKKLYFLKSEIDQWLKNGRRKTNAELSAEASSYTRKKAA
jgi:excisionase family DNA binding protein